MIVKCKFYVNSVELMSYGGYGDTPQTVGRTIKMRGIQSPPFGEATPNAHLEMLIVTDAADYFEIDGQYEVTFTKIEDGIGVGVIRPPEVSG